MSRDPRVDQQIATAPEWAATILIHLRTLIHEAAPDVTEDIKWGRPFFLIGDKPFAMMAAFTAHCTFGFWKMGKPKRETEGGGQYGKITALADLPDTATLRADIREAVETARSDKSSRPKPPAKPPIATPPDLDAALTPAARAALAALSPSARRDYLEWITTAKRPDTRIKRIAQAVAQLAEGKRLNWKYEQG